MFNFRWPDLSQVTIPPSQHADAAIGNITERAAALDLDIQDARNHRGGSDINQDDDDDSFEEIPPPHEEEGYNDEGEIHYHEEHREEQELDQARSSGVSAGMDNAGHGIPVQPDDPDAYEYEPFDPLDDNDEWKDYKEIEFIPDPSFCWRCYATQSMAEQEINQDYQDNKKLEMETLGKMSEFKRALAQQADYNLNIRPYDPFLIDKPVSLVNWRDHASVHTINPDVIEERSLRFLCSVRRHLEATTMLRPKKRKADQLHPAQHDKLDQSKLKIWLQIEAPIKRLMTEQRRRLSTLI